MNSLQPRTQSCQQGVIVILMSFLLLFTACSTSTSGSIPTPPTNTAVLPTNTIASTSTVGATAGTSSIAILVYFSSTSDSNFSHVFPVSRISPNKSVGTYAIQEIIAGPTLEEQSQGYYSELNNMFTGPSTCTGPAPNAGPDFTLTLNVKGTTPENGTATVKFCRSTSSPGIGTDARVTAEITTTLLQFSTIKKVILLTSDGHCFGDGSGMDICLKP